MWGVCVATPRPQQSPAEEQEVGNHEGTFLSSSKAEAARSWGLGPGLEDPAVGTGGQDVGTFPNQAGIGDRPCRGFRALEEEVERSVGKG